ncbi:glycosyltransferase [Methylophaga thiooxydans]|uniref:Glycosyl transferase, group 1 family protein n=1 Tax=Methylophaga thiooxydans DMS010 TaxID=637616 RepID=C0N604_9GAMM|nr:glycosyltransferase [Methylophaga thiooxydans]EEF79936.1 glycosyl transferase, group 1 family protein [Methylophaga thiooxydans DMS010]
MRICQLLLSRGQGGLEKHVRELTIQLHADGHDVIVVADRSFLRDLPAGIERHAIPSHLSRFNPLLLFSVVNILRQINADIIHAQANKAATVLSKLHPWLAAKTVGTVHNIKRNLTPYKKLDHVITVSQQLSNGFKDNVSVVYNGIAEVSPQPRDLRQAFHLDADKPVLVAVGRLVEAKGFDMLLEAIRGLPLSLLIIGEGPERQTLEKRIQSLPSTTQCHLLGQREDATHLMASADAVVISSRREGFSYVFNEAVLCNSRVLATDVPVANEVLPSDLITPIADPKAFRTRLQNLLADLLGWSTLMQKPQRQAAETMTLRAMSSNTVNVYQSLITTHAKTY